jgi:hypothetical protein
MSPQTLDDATTSTVDDRAAGEEPADCPQATNVKVASPTKPPAAGRTLRIFMTDSLHAGTVLIMRVPEHENGYHIAPCRRRRRSAAREWAAARRSVMSRRKA